MALRTATIVVFLAIGVAACGRVVADDLDPYYHHEGALAGSLKSDEPLPLYDTNPTHLWNRLFAALYTRRSELPSQAGGPPVPRIEGGDWIDFLGWSGTTYWSQADTCCRIEELLDEFLEQGGSRLVEEPLRRAVFQRDLWSAFDFLMGQNIERFGGKEQQRRRAALCRKLAAAIRELALPRPNIEQLPDTYAAAVASRRFVSDHAGDYRRDYLPADLLSQEGPWVEIDFYQPDLHEDLEGRFITLHTRAYRGRSYFCVFYNFPGGREALHDYLQYYRRLLEMVE